MTNELKCRGCGKKALGSDESKRLGACSMCRTNDNGGERGTCPSCGFLIDTCMYFEKEDNRNLICPKCKYEACNYGWYPKSFQQAKKEYQRSLQT